MEFDVRLADIEAARARVAGRVRRTPTYVSPALSRRLGVEVVVKLEGLQAAGSFKPRGVFNKLLQLTEAERAKGIVTVSGGNHAIATAMAASALGAKALVLSAVGMAPLNQRLTEEAGGTVELLPDFVQAFAKAEKLGREGMTYVHPIDDPAIIAGHGTLGLELAEDGGPITHAYVSIGGGGFVSGVGTALKAKVPGIRVIGVETEGADTMASAFAAGHPVTIKPTSIAKTLNCPMTTERTYAGGRATLERVVLVPDASAVAGLLAVLEDERVLIEPAAGCVVAAALAERDRFAPGDRVALVLCGSNVALSDVVDWKARFGL